MSERQCFLHGLSEMTKRLSEWLLEIKKDLAATYSPARMQYHRRESA